MRSRWPGQSAASPPAQLPPWIMEIPLAPPRTSPLGLSAGAHAPTPPPPPPPPPARPHQCPALVWRQIRWPATDPGLVVQMPCPAHAHSAEPYAASLACLASGQWAPRVQAPRCQSIWLRNLTQRLEAGDSPLSILVELAHWTRPVAVAPGRQTGGHAGLALFGDDVTQIGRITRRLVDEMGDLLNRIGDDKQRVSFAREMVQVSY